VWLSVYNVFVVSVFWAFMADLWREDQARRLYGLIAAGGSAGAIAGPAVVALFATKVGIVPLLILAAVLLQVAVACVFWLVRWAKSRSAGAIAGHVEEKVGGGVFAGFRLALTSPYLAGIALMIALYALGSTTLYVEQTRLLKDALPDAASRASLLSRVDLTQNTLVALVEIVGTGWIMTRLGLSTALVVLPALTVAGLAVYGLFPTLPVLIVVGVARRVAHFALERPAREALFTVVTAEEKYKAKSFLDTVVYRGSDWLATQLQAGAAVAGIAGPALALGLAPVALVGLPLAFYLARRQKALAAQGVAP
jgi:AAA family ATP:ADP antiporter